MLYLGEGGAHGVRHGIARERETDKTVGFVDGPIGFDAQCVLRYAAAIAETRSAIVAGARINLAESIAHGATIGRGLNTVKADACFRLPIRP